MGSSEGSAESTTEDSTEVSTEDSTEGSTEGSLEGSTEGSTDGSTEGSTDGSTDYSANYSTDDSTEDSNGGSAEWSISGQKTCGAPGYMRSLPVSGQTMTSPFFPAHYPNNFKRKRTIEAPKGNFINIQFTDFEVDTLNDGDFVQITDGDGTFLGHFGARHQLTMENATFNVSSNTETVHVLFRTDQSHTRSGWRLVWSEWILSLSEVNPNPNFRFFFIVGQGSASQWFHDLSELSKALPKQAGYCPKN